MPFEPSSMLLSPLRFIARAFTGMLNSSDGLPPGIVLDAPSPVSMEETVYHEVLVDYATNDYRGFIFVVHETLGLMLLHCTRKKSKGPHWQLPGGHIDDHEFLQTGQYEQA
jgi:8-oxo-dGTP pyrophosphatase MutT (NUDIX family)